MDKFLVSYQCLECNFVGIISVNKDERKLTCPTCQTVNDFWLTSETPPPNHHH